MTRRSLLSALPLLGVFLATGLASGQDARLAEARREGKVVWHTALALDSAQRVAARFEQAYAGIRMAGTTGRSSRRTARCSSSRSTTMDGPCCRASAGPA